MSLGHQKATPVSLEDTGGSALEDRSSESGSDTLFSREGVRLMAFGHEVGVRLRRTLAPRGVPLGTPTCRPWADRQLLDNCIASTS